MISPVFTATKIKLRSNDKPGLISHHMKPHTSYGVLVASRSEDVANITSILSKSEVKSNSFLLELRINCMKVISAITGTPSMSKEEVDTFLENKLNLQIGTIDDEGDPNIQPVWFNYDKDREKFLIITPKAAKKIKNLQKNPNVYFSIDDENLPYKGVKGKGIATVVEDPVKAVSEAKKINMKYLGTLDHPIPKMILESAQKGNHVIVEINPKFFSTWDFGKMQ